MWRGEESVCVDRLGIESTKGVVVVVVKEAGGGGGGEEPAHR